MSPAALAPLPSAAAAGLSEGFKSVPSVDTCRGLSCRWGPAHWFNVAVKWIQFFFPPVSHNKFTRVMIGVWACCTQRMWLFISNGQQFSHLSSHRAQYTPRLPFFTHLSPLLPSSASLHPYICISSFSNPSFTFSLHLPLPPCIPSFTSSFRLSPQMVPSVLIEAIAQAHHAKCRWLQLNASLWASSESQGTGRRIHLPWQ